MVDLPYGINCVHRRRQALLRQVDIDRRVEKQRRSGSDEFPDEGQFLINAPV